jgi:diaminohydroxyphosphoribosylaminopyrimidine deaminase/5-amino-6-(5-phosphoribosylamino)uracil reductase
VNATAGFSAADHGHMTRALRLARRGVYTTHPNPRVGCVLVADGRVVGTGWHRLAGEPHAEILALRDAGAAARGATAFVTLEPCAHHGRTPPCAPALVEAGIRRVVVPAEDPNPRVAGKGLALLRAAGLRVDTGLLADEAERLNAGFNLRMTAGRPRVTVKLAASLDGRTAMASGESRWITGPDARADVQRLRAASSAIMTGIGTVLADDPSLNVRAPELDLAGRQPLRVVLDSRLRLPPDARLLGLPGRTIVMTGAAEGPAAAALREAGADIVRIAAAAGGVDPAAALGALAERECNDVLVEAGPTLAGTLAGAGLIDELVLFLAPHLMGDGARGLFSLPGLEKMADRVQWRVTEWRQVGADLRIRAVPAAPGD